MKIVLTDQITSSSVQLPLRKCNVLRHPAARKITFDSVTITIQTSGQTGETALSNLSVPKKEQEESHRSNLSDAERALRNRKHFDKDRFDAQLRAPLNEPRRLLH